MNILGIIGTTIHNNETLYSDKKQIITVSKYQLVNIK